MRGRASKDDAPDDDGGVVVARGDGERLLLTYPMETVRREVEGGKAIKEYLMQCKTVHPRTGQLAKHWVVVAYDELSASGDVEAHVRCVGDFTLQ